MAESRPVDKLFPGANRVASIDAGVCVNPPIGCGKKADNFRDELSRQEYSITGLCQDCQDSVWGK